MAEVHFTLAAGQGGGQISKEDAAKQQAQNAAIRKSFDDGVALTNEGKNEEAIAKFNEVIAAAPKCAECYANIATVYGRMKDYDKAEAAFKKAIEVKPDFAEAYNGLSTVYNAEKKFDLAAEAIASHRDVDRSEPALISSTVEHLARQQDHAGAGPEGRHARRQPLGDRLVQT